MTWVLVSVKNHQISLDISSDLAQFKRQLLQFSDEIQLLAEYVLLFGVLIWLMQKVAVKEKN